MEWSDHVDRALGTAFLVSTDKSLRSQGGCSRRRPDKLYASADLVEVDECDEHQHARTGSSDYTCDEKRLSEIYDDPSICGKPMVVIRWNPHAYTVPDGSRSLCPARSLESVFPHVALVERSTVLQHVVERNAKV